MVVIWESLFGGQQWPEGRCFMVANGVVRFVLVAWINGHNEVSLISCHGIKSGKVF